MAQGLSLGQALMPLPTNCLLLGSHMGDFLQVNAMCLSLLHLLSGVKWGHTPRLKATSVTSCPTSWPKGIFSHLLSLFQALWGASLFTPFAIPPQGEKCRFHTKFGHEMLAMSGAILQASFSGYFYNPNLISYPHKSMKSLVDHHIIFLLAPVTNEHRLGLCNVTHSSMFFEE